MQPIEKILAELQDAKPEIRGTTLITYIVHGSMDLCLVAEHLTAEIATACNIKSKHVRSSVTDSLKSLMRMFKTYCHDGKTPANGLVMLAGSLAGSSSVDPLAVDPLAADPSMCYI